MAPRNFQLTVSFSKREWESVIESASVSKDRFPDLSLSDSATKKVVKWAHDRILDSVDSTLDHELTDPS